MSPTNRPSKLKAAGLFTVASAAAGVVAGLIAFPAAGAVGFSAMTAVDTYEGLPAELTSPPLPLQSVMKAADGTDIATLYSENRIEVPLDAISLDMQHAMVAIEDSRFYEHNGVDLRGTVRALANNATGEDVQGASTITMQYVKNVLVTLAKSPEQQAAATARSASRKAQEIKYAIELEKQLSKPDILNRYLNISYFGAGAYGVEAAAQRYFSKTAAELTLVESATLAGIVQSPSRYDPTINPEVAEQRRNDVLRRMAELNYITDSARDEAMAIPVVDTLNPTEPPNGCAVSEYPFFCDYAIRQLLANPLFGETLEEREQYLATGGLTINTSLNLQAQDAAQEAVNDYIPPDDASGKAAAIAMVQPGTGNIEAMAQNRWWGTEGDGYTTYNYAVDQAYGGTIGMQAGSTFKIYTIASALEQGIDPFTDVNANSGIYFSGGDWGCDGLNFPGFRGVNSTTSGRMNMIEATAYSTNTYFIQREKDAGLCNVVEMAERAGVVSATGDPLEPNITFTLGTTEVSPLTVANSYATFAAHGLRCDPRALFAVIDRDGNVVDIPVTCEQTIPRDVADATTAILTNVVDGNISGRTGADMTLGRETTGKTGTTDSQAAVWFAGYTPSLAAAVWVGDPRGGFEYPLRNVRINGRYYSKVTGGGLPGPIWKQAMQGALSGTSWEKFDLESKYGLRSAQQGGGTDSRTAAVVAAYNEYVETGRFTSPSGQSVRPNFSGTPTYEEFEEYYTRQYGSSSTGSSASPATQRYTYDPDQYQYN